MNKKYDVVAVGDLMIDFTYAGLTEDGISIYERNPGGSPMNVAAQVAALGGTASVIATVGNDEHGLYLKKVIQELGIDTTNVMFSENNGTRMLFVHFKEGNDRYFFDSQGARSDLEIYYDQIDRSTLEESKVFLYTPLAHEVGYPISETVEQLLGFAREKDILVAYDPNYRFPYKTESEHIRVSNAIKTADILKLTIEEMNIILGEEDVHRGIKKLLDGNAKIVAVTMGEHGCLLGSSHGVAYSPTYDVAVRDTTGAGDSFMGALLYSVTNGKLDIEALEQADLERMAAFCNACASGCTMHRGSLLVMSDIDNADKIMREIPQKSMPWSWASGNCHSI